jgi:hypothetical protein
MQCAIEKPRINKVPETKYFLKTRIKAPKELDLNLIKKSYSSEELRFSNDQNPPPDAPLPNKNELWKDSLSELNKSVRAKLIRIKAYSV